MKPQVRIIVIKQTYIIQYILLLSACVFLSYNLGAFLKEQRLAECIATQQQVDEITKAVGQLPIMGG